MKLKVFLNKDFENLGKKGDIIEVNSGYARNFLLPQGIAVQVSGKMEEARVYALKQKELRQKNETVKAFSLKDKLDGATVVISAEAGEGGKLFGSVTKVEIAETIKQELKISIDKKSIEIDTPIRSLGKHPVKIFFGKGTEATLIVEVKPRAT
ncbi:MAG: 50S ribosomal protein L9 [candidate division WS2 bacterium]|nr:50S ribosomal protein L9 [Candidatus Lithacetigena glycinireducens]